ncbi:hypothetical protein ACRU13_21755 [Mycobacterium colombiense]
MEFQMNPGWEEELQRQLRPAMQKIADDNQPQMDDLFRRYAGRSVEEIKPAVEREIASWGGSMSDDGLTRIATAISEGQRVILRGGE